MFPECNNVLNWYKRTKTVVWYFCFIITCDWYKMSTYVSCPPKSPGDFVLCSKALRFVYTELSFQKWIHSETLLTGLKWLSNTHSAEPAGWETLCSQKRPWSQSDSLSRGWRSSGQMSELNSPLQNKSNNLSASWNKPRSTRKRTLRSTLFQCTSWAFGNACWDEPGAVPQVCWTHLVLSLALWEEDTVCGVISDILCLLYT